MSSDTKGRFIGIVGLGSIAVWLTLNLGMGFYRSLISQHWPAVPVRIASSAVVSGVSTVGHWWGPDVEYEYQFAGRTYRSSTIRFLMPVFYGEDDARSIQSAYPQNGTAIAAYDPDDPSRSVLEPGVPGGMWKQALIPVFFWILTAYLYYEATHPHRRVLMVQRSEF
ncbi:MAG: DUF3592 domain-containing protein [Candidatus Korobacteraceae bacterium]